MLVRFIDPEIGEEYEAAAEVLDVAGEYIHLMK